eukprot:CAMPEP_0170653996 /NCGR_PEP_ID=MMETSP0224-20130122/47694_1 /TAXON_ID=285029 /ORGANISM="Togula jolla, Strain CCCM 725" /LENGTH=36 /DNA_ID= /DNA_START= /DNA_END= /DNA_ORIENTATION=
MQNMQDVEMGRGDAIWKVESTQPEARASPHAWLLSP